ncbi:MAG TPA: hypothetical protein VIV11_39400 [Kofleriaceae bacterium]
MRPINKIGRVDSLQHPRRLALACMLLSGCLDGAPSTQPQLTARERWTAQAWPALATCNACHGKQPAIDFLAPGTVDEAYTTVFEFQPPVIDVGVPGSSLLLTMGKHTGPQLDPTAASAVLAWLEAERDERVPDMGESVRVGPFLPTLGTPMIVDLGVNGATLTLLPEAGEAGLYLSKLTLNAGGGLRMTHPLFVSRPPKPVLDEIDRYADLDLSLAAGAVVELGPAAFLSFDPNDYLTIHFKTLEAP